MGFFSSLLNQSQATACVLPETHAVIRQMVSVLGFDVVSSPDYESRVVPVINAAVEYFDQQITFIPGPLDISAAHYMHHPLVHALFPARQEIAHGIGRSMDVKQSLAFLSGADQAESFGLLGVRRQKDSPQGFCEHTLRTLAATESGARQGLRTAALMHVVTGFGEHVDKLRHRVQLPRAEWNIENRPDPAPAGDDKGKLVLASEELQPGKLLNGLLSWLQRPAEHLRVEGSARPGGSPGDPAQQIETLPGLRTRDRRRWLVCLVRFPTAEGVAAIQNEARQYRYIRI
jgi:hypothetical protein